MKDCQRLVFLLWVIFTGSCLCAYAPTTPRPNLGCTDNNDTIREDGETWNISSSCEVCTCEDGNITCNPINMTCPDAPDPSCNIIPGDGCCPEYDCNQTMCPDPNSYHRHCFIYKDKCQNDSDCYFGESCCLVSGCGKECMHACMDIRGVFHFLGEIWKISTNLSFSFICLEDGIHEIADDCPLNPLVLNDNAETENDRFPRQAEANAIRSVASQWPVKDTGYYISNYETTVGQTRTGSGSFAAAPPDSLRGVDLEEVQSFADQYNWSSVVPLLTRNIDNEERSAFDVGDRSLQTRTSVNRRIEEMGEKLPSDSPSVKHQDAFRRTDDISLKMGNLGHIIGKATADIVNRFDIPEVATTGLSLLGESSECLQRFNSFQRPNLSPSCSINSRYRTLDGSCNNPNHIFRGAAFTKLRRSLPSDYADGISELRRSITGASLPSARLVSFSVNHKSNVASKSHTILLMTFGQFLDHDLTATPVGKGYLGGHVKCCDGLKVLFDESLQHLNDTKSALNKAMMLEPSLENVDTEVLDLLLHDLEETKTAIFNRTSEDSNATDDTSSNHRETRQTSPLIMSLNPGTDRVTAIPFRPTNEECAPISIPANDPFYSRFGQTCMEFVRSIPAAMCTFGPREQLNQHSAYLDGSVIYGVQKGLSNSLRTFQNGRLKATETLEGQRLLPPSHSLFDGCNIPEKFNIGQFCFVAGDGRVNEQPLLTLLQTVWKREHNRIAKILQDYNSDWNDERVFQETRRIVIAELQQVTYNEFLKAVLGPFLMNLLDLNTLDGGSKTTDYDSGLDASISNVFATAAYRFGHSMINDFILEINEHGITSAEELSSLFFFPFKLYEPDTMANLARGARSQPAGRVDPFFSEAVSGDLFKGIHNSFGLDLVALNIQRGRDHGLRGYTQWREHCGLEPIKSFNDLYSVMDSSVVNALRRIYRNVHDIDIFVGGVAENSYLGGILGPTFTCLVADQFARLKRGDRYWFEYRHSPGAFTEDQLTQLHKVTLARILCNNIPELEGIQPRPLENIDSSNRIEPCYRIPNYSLRPWSRRNPIVFPTRFVNPN